MFKEHQRAVFLAGRGQGGEQWDEQTEKYAMGGPDHVGSGGLIQELSLDSLSGHNEKTFGHRSILSSGGT